MPVHRSELEVAPEAERWPLYRTLLGLFYDNPDVYYREDEVIEFVDRPAELVRLQLWLVRAAGAVEAFQVDVRYRDGEAWYGLATTDEDTPFDRLTAESADPELAALLDRLIRTIPDDRR